MAKGGMVEATKNPNKMGLKQLDRISKQLDTLIALSLVKSGLDKKEIADYFGVSEKTIQRLIPYNKLKKKKNVDGEDDS
jgi:hypothetical protein